MVSVIFLQGCAIAYIGAHLGMLCIAVTQIRPDRKLDYTFEIKTGQNETLIFQDSTDCPHAISANSGGYYSTGQSYSVLMQDDKRWVLTGMYCNDEIKTKGKRRFVVYQ